MNSFSINTVPSKVQTPTATSFCFRKRCGRIDWRSLASVDVDRIAQEMDFQALQANIMNITFCNIDSEEFHDVDVNFIKLFRLAQLMIEYLLHSQQYLSDLGTQLEQKLQTTNQDLAKVQEQLSTKEDEIKSLKKENRKRRKIIEAYQDMLNAGATGLHTCPVCSREFISAQYVQSHMHRRHPDHLPPQKQDSAPNLNQQEELEKRLLEQMMEQLQEKELLESQAREFEGWKKSEQEKMKMEMQAFKEPILADIRNIQQEKAELEEALQQHQAELQSLKAKKQSHLGHLEGAEELVSDGSKQLAEKARSEVAQMKKQLESQVQEMQSTLKKQEKIWKRKMQELGATCQDQIKDSMGKLQTLEDSLHESMQQKDLSHQQALLSQQIASFHQKLKHHEEQLHSQQEQLSSLQSREPSPTPVASPSKTAQTRADFEVASESEESETTSVNGDEIDSPGFYTPLKHRPEIRTLYDHQPEVLENIKRESLAILNDSMVQRGLPKNAVGISTHQFEENMKTLNKERQQRVHAHYNFTGEREKLKELVEDVMEKNCEKETKVKEKPQSKKTKLSSSLPAGSQISSKPPKPSSTKNTAQPVPINVVTMVGAATPHPSHSSPPVTKKETVKVESFDSSVTEEVLASESSEVFSESVDHLESNATQDHPHTKQKDNLDSPWDSGDDSIEELATQFHTGRTSSTPIKVVGLTTNKAEQPAKHDRLSEVQGSTAKDESDDSWDVSELSNPSAPVKSKPISVKTSNVSSKDRPKKQLSQTVTGTSQSALTTVSVEDLEDSDLSDWT